MYNRVEKSAPPRQTPTELLTAVREETQQLEEELTNHQEVAPGGTAHPGTKQGIQTRSRNAPNERCSLRPIYKFINVLLSLWITIN